MRGADFLRTPAAAAMIVACAVGSSDARAAASISGAPPTIVVAGEQYRFAPSAQSSRRRGLRFRIENKPHWARFDRRSGELSGSPPHDAIGAYRNVRIVASNGRKAAALPPFTISVVPPEWNRAPEISGTPPTVVRAGEPYIFSAAVREPDGQALEFTVENKPEWASFSPLTGALVGTPWPGVYESIVIGVSDGRATVKLPPFTIIVLDGEMHLGLAR